ncbi:MAG: efflux RND transporter periplasmic adaptor subunit [Patescibacteria group bacterium]
MLKKLFKQKLITGLILVLVLIGTYLGYKIITNKNKVPRYLIAAVKKDTLIVSVSGSGQISSSDQIEIKPKVSGKIAEIYVEKGDKVKAGKLIMKLDDKDFKKAVRDAERSLETAKLELEKLLEPPDELTIHQAESSLVQARDNLTKLKFSQERDYQKALDAKQKAEENLEKAYEDGFNTIANAFLDLPTIVTGIRDILYSYEIGESERTVSRYQWNVDVYRNALDWQDRDKIEPFIRTAEDSYKTAKKNYDQNFENYKNASRYSEKNVIEALLDETIETTKSIAEAVKNETNLLDFVVDYLSDHDRKVYSKINEYQSNLKSYTSKINNHLLNLLSIQRTIKDNKEARSNALKDIEEMEQNHPLNLAAAERTVKEKELALAKLKKGPDELDIRAKKIAIQQKEDALITAKENLIDCYIYAPFDGIIADVKVKKNDMVSTGTVLASIITQQKIAEISLNEVDAAKVKVGQKATLTFDALPDLTLTGKVIEIDTVGTVSQGVVSYGVKIALDTEDERIKPSMSVTADIIVDAKSDVLVLPNNAIKSSAGIHYVELIEIPKEKKQEFLNSRTGIILPSPPKIQQIEIGISNDNLTEILSGLKEGDIVISSTISQTKTNQTQRTRQFQIPGMGGQMRMR